MLQSIVDNCWNDITINAWVMFAIKRIKDGCFQSKCRMIQSYMRFWILIALIRLFDSETCSFWGAVECLAGRNCWLWEFEVPINNSHIWHNGLIKILKNEEFWCFISVHENLIPIVIIDMGIAYMKIKDCHLQKILPGPNMVFPLPYNTWYLTGSPQQIKTRHCLKTRESVLTMQIKRTHSTLIWKEIRYKLKKLDDLNLPMANALFKSVHS